MLSGTPCAYAKRKPTAQTATVALRPDTATPQTKPTPRKLEWDCSTAGAHCGHPPIPRDIHSTHFCIHNCITRQSSGMKTIHLHYAHFNIAASTMPPFCRQKAPRWLLPSLPGNRAPSHSIGQAVHWPDETLDRRNNGQANQGGSAHTSPPPQVAAHPDRHGARAVRPAFRHAAQERNDAACPVRASAAYGPRVQPEAATARQISAPAPKQPEGRRRRSNPPPAARNGLTNSEPTLRAHQPADRARGFPRA